MLDQPGAAPGNEQVETVVHLHEVVRSLMAGILHQRDAVFAQPVFPQRLAHQFHQHAVRLDRFAAAAQITDIAAFQAEGRRVHTDIGAGLKDDADDTDRHAFLHEVQLFALPFFQYTAAGVFQPRDFPHARADAGDAPFIQRQAVDKRFAAPAAARRLDIPGIGLQDLRPPGIQDIRHPHQRGILRLRFCLRQGISGLAAAYALFI